MARSYYKIRKLTSNDKTGDTYGVTLSPKIIKEFGKGIVKQSISGSCIILTRYNPNRFHPGY